MEPWKARPPAGPLSLSTLARPRASDTCRHLQHQQPDGTCNLHVHGRATGRKDGVAGLHKAAVHAAVRGQGRDVASAADHDHRDIGRRRRRPENAPGGQIGDADVDRCASCGGRRARHCGYGAVEQHLGLRGCGRLPRLNALAPPNSGFAPGTSRESLVQPLLHLKQPPGGQIVCDLLDNAGPGPGRGPGPGPFGTRLGSAVADREANARQSARGAPRRRATEGVGLAARQPRDGPGGTLPDGRARADGAAAERVVDGADVLVAQGVHVLVVEVEGVGGQAGGIQGVDDLHAAQVARLELAGGGRGHGPAKRVVARHSTRGDRGRQQPRLPRDECDGRVLRGTVRARQFNHVVLGDIKYLRRRNAVTNVLVAVVLGVSAADAVAVAVIADNQICERTSREIRAAVLQVGPGVDGRGHLLGVVHREGAWAGPVVRGGVPDGAVAGDELDLDGLAGAQRAVEGHVEHRPGERYKLGVPNGQVQEGSVGDHFAVAVQHLEIPRHQGVACAARGERHPVVDGFELFFSPCWPTQSPQKNP